MPAVRPAAGSKTENIAKVKSHNHVGMMLSGLLSRAIAIALGPEGKQVADTIDLLCSARRGLLKPTIKPEVCCSGFNGHHHYVPMFPMFS